MSDLITRLTNINSDAFFLLRCEAAREIQRLTAELREAHIHDGHWMDSRGSCRVCGGEIPGGHTSTCYLYKQEQRAESTERLLQEREMQMVGLVSLLQEIYNWTNAKHAPWAVKTKEALANLPSVEKYRRMMEAARKALKIVDWDTTEINELKTALVAYKEDK